MFLIRVVLLVLICFSSGYSAQKPKPVSTQSSVPTTEVQLRAEVQKLGEQLEAVQKVADAAELEALVTVIKTGVTHYPAEVRRAILEEFAKWARAIQNHTVGLTPPAKHP